MSDYIHNTGEFTSTDGLRLFYQTWKQEKPTGLIVLCHGVGDHSGRYVNLLDTIKDDNLSVYTLDHRGHGRSEGKRGHIMSFDEYVDDFDLIVQLAKNDHPDLPVIIMGHSLGGVIAFKYVLKYGQDFAGLILSSAGFKNKVEVSPLKIKLALFLSRNLPALTMSTGLDSKLLSHDPNVVQAYINDPLVHDRVSSRWYTEFISAGQECLDRSAELNLPLLIIHGQADEIVDYHGSEEVMQKAGSLDKELHIFENLYHETMNETAAEKEKVLNVIKVWLLKHIA